jgi:hypothetical protein
MPTDQKGFPFLKCCCPDCPPCPYPFSAIRGYTTQIIPGCNKCPDCPPCPTPFQESRGWFGTPIPGCTKCPECPPCPPPYSAVRGWTSSPITHCTQCPPPCENNPCFVTIPGLACPCIPQRFLAIASGIQGCSCFVASTGDPPNSHFETLGSPDGAYCFGPGGLESAPPSVQQRAWGDDGPPDCAPPTSLTDDLTGGSINVGVTFGGGVITIEVRIGGPIAPMFCGRITSTNCAGPWIVPNQLTPGCSYALSSITGFCAPLFSGSPYLIGGSGGTVTIYPCQC